MSLKEKIEVPKYSLSEELLSSISHGIGTLLSVVALILCIIVSCHNHNIYGVISSSIYGATSILLYTMSTLYHGLKVNNAKRIFRIFDHCSIFLLIAGTYTPISLVTLREATPWIGWSVFGVIWACAIIGITLNAIDLKKFKVFSMVLYLVMGWMIIFTSKTILNNLNMSAIYLILGGGVLYTFGAILYGLGKKMKYMHSIFHFYVLAASICFFFAIYGYIL